MIEHLKEAQRSKASESDELTIVSRTNPAAGPRNDEGRSTNPRVDDDGLRFMTMVCPSNQRALDPSKYFTDTSEVEELMVSSGVGGPVTPQTKSTPTFVKVPRQRAESTSGKEPCGELPGTSQERPQVPRLLSASGRSLLRKQFVSKDPIIIPWNQPVISLTEGQMHTVLKTISDETILSSFHLMKSLLLQVTSGKILSKERCRHVGAFTSYSRQGPSRSEGETLMLIHLMKVTPVGPSTRTMRLGVCPSVWTMKRLVREPPLPLSLS